MGGYYQYISFFDSIFNCVLIMINSTLSFLLGIAIPLVPIYLHHLYLMRKINIEYEKKWDDFLIKSEGKA